ncbi:sulfurtransferase complex subunit TusD [Zooshikella marina]|uniref:sulfurtransferase complex subunit TusD n=1 Tax=Zooshikella ganghwensis TaxID=202772 RepID=UPI001BAEA9FA|nr:sulfurtransferase complex subunit TusD [Zooshikella ganghwensis]MBU2705085.1 sulfurtransferase complex subunit TusD [Zooshikella ganghwensis]
MIFSLTILGAPNHSAAPSTGLRFAKALLADGHQIYRIFFYGEGVYTASRIMVPPQDEYHLSKAWQDLITEYQLDTVVCIAAALRRGIIDEQEQQRYQLDTNNMMSHAELSGLGQWVDACLQSDRMITFGE